MEKIKNLFLKNKILIFLTVFFAFSLLLLLPNIFAKTTSCSEKDDFSLKKTVVSEKNIKDWRSLPGSIEEKAEYLYQISEEKVSKELLIKCLSDECTKEDIKYVHDIIWVDCYCRPLFSFKKCSCGSTCTTTLFGHQFSSACVEYLVFCGEILGRLK